MKRYFAILPLTLAIFSATAQADTVTNNAVFNFSTTVSREVDNDLMTVVVYSQKTGKNLAELKQAVSKELNKVIENAKVFPQIQLQTDGMTNYPDYTKNKVTGWVSEGRLQLSSKDFEAMAKVLESLGENIAISNIDFNLSPEATAALEDEMTLEAIKQFQHKAEVISKGLNGKGYQLKEVHLDTPNGENHIAPRAMVFAAKMADDAKMPLEAGKRQISANATGTILIEQ